MNLQFDIDQFKLKELRYLEETEAFYKNQTIFEAIQNAASGNIKRGEKVILHTHQYLIGYEKCKLAAQEILKYEEELISAKCFEEIFKITERVKSSIRGLGNLWSYDTALHISFNKNLYPKDVYVQAGVAKGVRKLMGPQFKFGRKISLDQLPNEFKELLPHQIEFFLCRYGRKDLEMQISLQA